MAAPFLVTSSRIKPWIKQQLILWKNTALYNRTCVHIKFTCCAYRQYNLPPRSLLGNGDKYRWSVALQNRQQHKETEKQSEKENVKLMEFPEIVWPSFLKSMKNYILSRLVIQMHFDPDFNLDDFMAGSRHAVVKVSHLLSEGDIDSLKGLVTEEAISELKPNLAQMSLKQRQELAIKMGDMYFGFIHIVGIMFDENTSPQKRFVEISCCFHCLPGFEDLKLSDPTLTNMYEQRHKIIICNYRFIREFTKGINDQWVINKLNHFKPTEIN